MAGAGLAARAHDQTYARARELLVSLKLPDRRWYSAEPGKRRWDEEILRGYSRLRYRGCFGSIFPPPENRVS